MLCVDVSTPHRETHASQWSFTFLYVGKSWRTSFCSFYTNQSLQISHTTSFHSSTLRVTFTVQSLHSGSYIVCLRGSHQGFDWQLFPHRYRDSPPENTPERSIQLQFVESLKTSPQIHSRKDFTLKGCGSSARFLKYTALTYKEKGWKDRRSEGKQSHGSNKSREDRRRWRWRKEIKFLSVLKRGKREGRRQKSERGLLIPPFLPPYFSVLGWLDSLGSQK